MFSERDIAAKPGEVAAALEGADAFFGSLLFDYDQARPWCRNHFFEWLVRNLIGCNSIVYVVIMMPASRCQPMQCLPDEAAHSGSEHAGSHCCSVRLR